MNLLIKDCFLFAFQQQHKIILIIQESKKKSS